MTREDILKLARVVGFHSAVLLHIYDGRDGALTDSEMADLRRIERFFRLAYEAGAAAERTACADICDQHASIEGIAQRCAAEIRARSKT